MSRRLWLPAVAVLLSLAPGVLSAAPSLDARYSSAYGWVRPGETYPFILTWAAGPEGATGATVVATLPPSAVFVSANPAPSAVSGGTLSWSLGALAPGKSGRIVVTARAMNLTEDPEVIWKDLSASGSISVTTAVGNSSAASRTRGPKVTTLETARYGERPFPLVMVQYQDIRRCEGPGTPYDECTGDHTAAALDEAVNSRTNGRSLWQLYNDMSFGQLQPVGSVRPAPGSNSAPFIPGYPYKFSQPAPNGTCTGVTLAAANGTPLYANRVEKGWYVLPGTQGYYGADRTGHALAGALTGQGLLFGVDDACGPTGKIAYDAAAIADPDLDYNDFDTDKDGVVDFFNVAFAGDGGNGSLTVTGVNNVWPHKSDLQYYFTDPSGQKGYVSNDQLKNHVGEPLYWTDASRKQMTTSPASGLKVFVRVGPYNVNPESAIDHMSVIAHEYGHSLGLPDFYSTGTRSTFGSWELMASDHAQFMTVFTRQDLGWIVPREAQDGVYTLKESKVDTGSITWKRPDGTPYTLTGPGIHNADALRVQLPAIKLIDEVPSGTRAWHSGAGNDFGCPGHTLDVYLPDLAQHGGASAVTLRFKSLYEIEWDWDYAFVLASTDGGQTWVSLPSKRGTTFDGFNPNNAECYSTYGNGITGVSGLPNDATSVQRVTGEYPPAQWIEDEFDLTRFKGQQLLLRFSYFTDPAVTKRGWFIDDLTITADSQLVYTSNFEGEEGSRLFPYEWSRVSSADGVNADHAYYIEVRDRVGWDFDGRGQSERGTPTWEPGVAVLYTDENHGYGNTGVDNPPAQTIVDAKPEPGNDNPNLDDAAYTNKPGREAFDACAHVDNYSTPAGNWKLPSGVNMLIQSIGGFSADGATSNASATLIIDANPDCSVSQVPPAIMFGAGHEDPDPDGAFTIEWQRPAGASGPDELQEASVYGELFRDDAEGGLGNWVVSADVNMLGWDASPVKKNSGTYSFATFATDLADEASSTLTLSSPLAVPAAGTTTLAFWDWFAGELDDIGVVEVSEDGGATWTALYQTARPVFADETVGAAEAPMQRQVIDLTPYAGLSIGLRFRYAVGGSNYILYAPVGWSVDDISIETANWTTVATTAATSASRSGLASGTYYYRVRTAYPAGPVTIPSGWSDVISTDVDVVTPPPARADLTAGAPVVRSKSKGKAAVAVTTVITNRGEAASAPSTTVLAVNGEVLASIATPSLAPGGSIEVTAQWKVNQLADGTYTLRASADATAAVDESNETNNAGSSSVRVHDGRVQQ